MVNIDMFGYIYVYIYIRIDVYVFSPQSINIYIYVFNMPCCSVSKICFGMKVNNGR